MRRDADAAAPSVDILVESPLWEGEPEHKAILRKAIAAAAARAASSKPAELAIVLTDDSAIRALNRKWRGRDEPTNVLSFPAGSARAVTDQAAHLGDIVIAYETSAREASGERKSFAQHLAHLAVHGYLHLLGFDHATEDQAVVMERLEAEILSHLGVANPYCGRG
jgi:probable rRNA maturation factor